MECVVDYAKNFIGTPYKWGGNNPIEGFDCSGYIQWILQSVGIDPKGDQTAQGLFNYFINNGSASESIAKGALVFYGKSPNNITHVALAINPYQVIEAAGGDSAIRTLTDAKKTGASVRQRLYDYRKDLVAVIKPNYPDIERRN